MALLLVEFTQSNQGRVSINPSHVRTVSPTQNGQGAVIDLGTTGDKIEVREGYASVVEQINNALGFRS
jgi:F0F1-type ATP synthase epsilon subunit